MPPLADVAVLGTWERLVGRLPVDQSVALLAAFGDEPADELAALSVGSRDQRLFDLHVRLFGPDVEAVATCPACDELLELRLDLVELVASLRPAVQPALEVERDGYVVGFRLPESLDLLAIADRGAGAAARRALLGRCVSRVTLRGKPVPVGQLPEELVAAVAARMAEADPFADVRLELHCQACRHRWQAAFDILAFLVGGLERWSSRTFEEVHELAAAYGWAERDILTMSGWRRRRYLELAGA